jgi:membrane-associated protease RseP (regulator of RpoE activity)
LSLERGQLEREGWYSETDEDDSYNDDRRSEESKQSYIVPLILFILTIITTLTAGAMQQGINPFANPDQLYLGIPFSLTLITILLTHEMGHYLTSKFHGVDATLPFFIPAPPIPFIIGTLGAFIKMRSPIMTKKALLDIGASGPLAGFVVSIVATYIGLQMSHVVPGELTGGFNFGWLSYLALGPIVTGEDVTIILHPIAFAGWIGFFVTSLNLLPIGQLDGGHITYAVLGKKHHVVSFIMTLILILFGLLGMLGIFGWSGWLIWGMLVSFLGLRHPPIMDYSSHLDTKRKVIGWLALLVFVVTFIPLPFSIS